MSVVGTNLNYLQHMPYSKFVKVENIHELKFYSDFISVVTAQKYDKYWKGNICDAADGTILHEFDTLFTLRTCDFQLL